GPPGGAEPSAARASRPASVVTQIADLARIGPPSRSHASCMTRSASAVQPRVAKAAIQLIHQYLDAAAPRHPLTFSPNGLACGATRHREREPTGARVLLGYGRTPGAQSWASRKALRRGGRPLDGIRGPMVVG